MPAVFVMVAAICCINSGIRVTSSFICVHLTFCIAGYERIGYRVRPCSGVPEIRIITGMLLFTLLGKGIPEPDELVTEFSQVFLHRQAAFLKNAITLFDYFIDQILRGKKEIDRNPGLL
jgi:hypothetical protein